MQKKGDLRTSKDSTISINCNCYRAKARNRKARGAFISFKSIWKDSSIILKTKVRIFKSNVLSGATLWHRTVSVVTIIKERMVETASLSK